MKPARWLLLGAVVALASGCGRDPFPAGGGRTGPLGGALPVDTRLLISGLSEPVDAVRDVHGRTHIYAGNISDAMRAEGYLVARDRGVQIELMRRLASGTVAEIFGDIDPGQVSSDIAFRTIGLRRTAEAQYAAAGEEERRILDAFADGVSQGLLEIRDGIRPLPEQFVVMEPMHFGPFDAVDALTIGRLQTFLLSYDGDSEIGFSLLLDDLRGTFNANAEEPELALLAGFERDYIRFAPPSEATTIDGLENIGRPTQARRRPAQDNADRRARREAQPGADRKSAGGSHAGHSALPSASRRPTPAPGQAALEAATAPQSQPHQTAQDAALEAATTPRSQPQQQPQDASQQARYRQARRAAAVRAEGFVQALQKGRALIAPSGDFGSNNWAVAPVRSAGGHAMLASDPHLQLSSPPVFWPVSIHVPAREDLGEPGLELGGIAFPGIPGIILGHNEHVAWGATVAGYDVTDVYTEQLSDDGEAVWHQGTQVPLQTVTEVIPLPRGMSVSVPVHIVPHHGPLVPTIFDGNVLQPDPSQPQLSIRWTGHAPTGELTAILKLMRARNVSEARAAFETYGTGAQNWMLADVDGNIGWTSRSHVPLRAPGALSWNADTYTGRLPCMILPGDGSADWTGLWQGDAVPWAINPLAGYLASANQDQVGGTLDNDPSDDVQPNGDSGFLACTFAQGFRQERIQARIEGLGSGLTLDDLSQLQGDVRSALAPRFVPALLTAMDNALKEFAAPNLYPELAEVVADPRYDQNRVAVLRDLLGAWRDGHDYLAASGIDPDSNGVTALDHPEAVPAQATLLFNVWLVRFIRRTLGDELSRIGRGSGTGQDIRAMLHLMAADPANLATFDAQRGDSVIWDDIDTPAIETRQERMIRALLDALSWLDDNVEGGIDWWRWGQHHTVRFQPLVPIWATLSVPPTNDPVFGGGFPRPGDMYAVDACNFDLTRALDDDPSFSYRSGPTQRFTIEMIPGALRVRNALPGGASERLDHPYFASQAEQWRRNAIHDVPFYTPDVIAAAQARAVLSSP